MKNIRLKVDNDTHSLLKIRAIKEGKTLENLVKEILSDAVKNV